MDHVILAFRSELSATEFRRIFTHFCGENKIFKNFNGLLDNG